MYENHADISISKLYVFIQYCSNKLRKYVHLVNNLEFLNSMLENLLVIDSINELESFIFIFHSNQLTQNH